MSMFTNLHRSPSAAQLTSDASGGWGCGGYTSTGQWFQLQWPESWQSVHITVKELVPIVIACVLWGNAWKGKTIRCRCDNAAVVAIVRSGTSKHQLVMHLMRCLFFFVAVYQVYLEPVHLPGVRNEAADALSRDNVPRFMQLVPDANPSASPVRVDLHSALIQSTPDWSSQAWTSVLHTTLCMD